MTIKYCPPSLKVDYKGNIVSKLRLPKLFVKLANCIVVFSLMIYVMSDLL